MLAFLFSWLGIGLLGAALIAGAVIAFLRGWNQVALVLALVAAAHIYSGAIYQSGKRECEMAVKIAVFLEQSRQQAEAAAALAVLQTQLDQKEASADLAWDVAARLQAEVDAGPKIEGRGATARDVEVLNAK